MTDIAVLDSASQAEPSAIKTKKAAKPRATKKSKTVRVGAKDKALTSANRAPAIIAAGYRPPALGNSANDIQRLLGSLKEAISEDDADRSGQLAYTIFGKILDIGGIAIRPADISVVKETLAGAMSRAVPIHPDHSTLISNETFNEMMG